MTDQVCWSNRDEVTRELILYGSWYVGGWTWGGWDPAQLWKSIFSPWSCSSLLQVVDTLFDLRIFSTAGGA